jgi:hypothetical protein
MTNRDAKIFTRTELTLQSKKETKPILCEVIKKDQSSIGPLTFNLQAPFITLPNQRCSGLDWLPAPIYTHRVCMTLLSYSRPDEGYTPGETKPQSQGIDADEFTVNSYPTT